jgi:hypothetical protein
MWIILRADTFDTAILTLQQFFTPTWWMITLDEIKNNVVALSLVATMLILHLLPTRTKDFCKEIFCNLPLIVKFIIAVAVIAALILIEN